MCFYQLYKETGVLHVLDSSKSGFLYKRPFRLNEGEFRRAYPVSENSEARKRAEESRRERPKWKGLRKVEDRRNEKLEVVGKRGRGTEVIERRGGKN